jgi:PAS domain S-box-containing protein
MGHVGDRVGGEWRVPGDGTRESESRMAPEETKIDLESLPDAVVVVDVKGRILQVNAHTEALLGYGHSELCGQRIEVLVPDRLRDEHTAHRHGYQEAPRGRAMGEGKNLCARHKNGREVPVEIMLSPGAAGSVVAIVRDISKRRELERFRDEYLGYISHDLKNPLSVITLQARLLARKLADRKLDEEGHAVEIIAQSAAFIDKMVRELLEMSYLEVEQVQIHKEPIDLVTFLKVVLERTVSTPDRERIRLEIHDAATVWIDVTRVERVVVNFVQNALKYAAPDSPIRVRLEARGNMAVVSVIDEGPGLTVEEATYVFDKYRRTLTTGKREGLGLGLYISQKIVEAHDGRIGVDSSPGKGSTFFFEIPMAKAERKEASVALTLDPIVDDFHARLRGAHVLIVDDEAYAVSALGELLRDEGIVVSTATSGAQALERAEAQRPDAVVLDVEMPGMGGLLLLQRLRERLPNIPAVFMTGYMSHHAGIMEARATTGAAYISKPVDVDELIRTLGLIVVIRAPQQS